MTSTRRKFIQSSTLLSLGIAITPEEVLSDPIPTREDNINVIGPKSGYSPQIGTLVSMLTWMRSQVLGSVQKLSQQELDYLHDQKSNTIGAMLFHLAATERFYQINTFEEKKWGDWDKADKDKFDVAMELGDEARKKIKGNSIGFYLGLLEEMRATTLAELKKRDDKWLMSVDKGWSWGPTNNYCKWFHVCEHESNHNGQIKWIAGRVPS